MFSNDLIAMKERREAVVTKLQELQAECAPLIKVLSNPELTKTLKAEKNFTPAFLEENHQVRSFDCHLAM
jgi:hypothetical protein